jgi:ribosomal peptide maturation radical SAM protein 1
LKILDRLAEVGFHSLTRINFYGTSMETSLAISRTLLIVPPFASIYRPSLGIHVLQSVARARGLQVDILYANLIFAAALGEAEYDAICEHPFMDFLGERIMGWFAGHTPAPDLTAFNQACSPRYQLNHARLLLALEAWREQVMHHIRIQPDLQPCLQIAPYACVGVSSTFDQTNACLILLRACRQALPDSTLIIGGANCEGAMAEGMAAYIPEVDHVFSGESELGFVDFLMNRTTYVGQKIIRCPPNNAINDLPPNDFSDYFQQFTALLPNSPKRTQLELPYESSRGCWWGQKHHCTFCGLNGQGMGFREKDPDKVFDELMALQAEGQATRILMADNIMPHSYFNTLLPRLAKARSGLYVFYEQKANIDLEKAILLKQAGIEAIQPGIEALHSGALKLMKKGVSAKQNIALLRYARALNIHVIWNYLYGFPGEQWSWFAELLQHLPALEHLQPPTGLHPINIDRFSPFFSRPNEYGFSNVRPHPAYAEIFSPSASPAQMAYHFCGDSNTLTLADSPLLPELQAMIIRWQQSAQQTTPKLLVLESGEGKYLLIDSRSFQPTTQIQTITAAQAAVCLAEHHTASAETDWALRQRTAIVFDGGFLPLATAEPQVMLHFESAPTIPAAPWTAIKVSAI